MPYLDLRGMKDFKEMQDASNAEKFAQIENGLVKNEQLINSLADDVVMVHVDLTDVNNPVLYRDKNGQQSEEVITGEFDKIYINVDSDKMGYYYWNGLRFILHKVSENALNDVNGNAITSYLKTLTLVNNKITVTNGAGVRNEFTIQGKEYNKASVSEDGLLSKEDKAKLDNIETNANNYNLPIATTSQLGGIILGNTFEIDQLGKVTVPDATDSSKGIMKLYNETGSNVDGTMTQSAISNLLSSIYTFKGTRDYVSELPTENNRVGDTYNIVNADNELGILAGDSVSWNGESWSRLTGSVNLSNYMKKNDTFIVSLSVSDNVLTVTPSNGESFSVRLTNDYVLPIASNVRLGGMKAGSGLIVQNDGTVSVNLESLNLTGTPTAVTPSKSDSSNRLATTAYVQEAIADLVEIAPQTLATLDKLKEDLQDQSAIESLTQQLGNKLDKTGGTIVGNLTIQGNLNATANRATLADTSTTALSAQNDTNGTNLLTYAKDVELVGNRLTVTQGNGTVKNYLTLNTTYNPADTSNNGLMTSDDKIKLNAIEANANNYSLPKASSSELGGIKVSTGLNIDNDGKLTVSDSNDITKGIMKLYTSTGNNIDGTMTQAAITSLLSSIYRFKGSVSRYIDLPDTDVQVGDTYNILNSDSSYSIIAGDSVSWNGTEWIKLAGSLNLSNYMKKDDTFIVSIESENGVLTITPSNGNPFSIQLTSDYQLTAATNSKLGGIKAGSGLNIENDGTLSVNSSNMNLTGTPTATTADLGDNTNRIATTAFVQTAVANMAETAPELIETLDKLKEQLDDSNVLDTLVEDIGNKLDKSGGTITGNLTVQGNITGTVSNATNASRATLADTATNDVNGNNLVSYVKSINLVGNRLTVTKGNNQQSEFLTENTTYSNASTTSSGLMSSEDKMKLDGIEERATRFNLNPATSSDLGGVKIGSNITNNEGTISVTKQNVLDALTYTPANINDVTRAYLISTIGYAGYTIKST